MNNNADIASSCKSLRRVRRRSLADVVQEPTAQELNFVEFHSKINDCHVAEDEQMETAKRVERRRAARRSRGASRRSRPDAKGRINGKECHAFAFAELIEEKIEADF